MKKISASFFDVVEVNGLCPHLNIGISADRAIVALCTYFFNQTFDTQLIFLNSTGGPHADSTNVVLPGNRTIAKIVLSED